MLKKNSKIFVAGSGGLVGSSIITRLENLGYINILSPRKSKLDLRDQFQVNKFFIENKPEIVFLAAAKVGGILANSIYRSDFIYDNLAISTNVIKASADNGVEKLINLGSSCIYPKDSPQPIKEDYLLSGKLEPTNEPYAIAKIAALKLCSAFNSSNGTNFITLMPTNLYGENDNFNLETTHVLPALLRKIILAKLLSEEKFDLIFKDISVRSLGFGIKPQSPEKKHIENILAHIGVCTEEVVVWGTGKPLREFMHTSDLAGACVYFAERVPYGISGDLINIGSGEEISIESLAMTIKNILGFEGKIVYDSSKPDGTPQKLLDSSKAEQLGWKSQIKLKEGIEKLAAYYLATLNA